MEEAGDEDNDATEADRLSSSTDDGIDIEETAAGMEGLEWPKEKKCIVRSEDESREKRVEKEECLSWLRL